MAITTVQGASGIAHASVPASSSATETVTATFGSNNTAGNVLFVWILLNQKGVGVSNSSPSVTDTRGNTYTQDLAVPPTGNNNGAGCWLYHATNIAGGANTITFSFQGVAGTFGVAGSFEYAVLAVEYSGMPSPAVQATRNLGIVGGGGNSPQTLTFPDSHAVSVSVTFGAGTNTVGVDDTGISVADILSGGANYLIAASLSNNATFGVPTASPSGYQTFAQEQMAPDATNGYYAYYWDSASPVPTGVLLLYPGMEGHMTPQLNGGTNG
jgi:hypothetical protein